MHPPRPSSPVRPGFVPDEVRRTSSLVPLPLGGTRPDEDDTTTLNPGTSSRTNIYGRTNMTEPIRVMDRDWAIHEIADMVRDRQHWIIATTPHTAERVADDIKDSWAAVAYLDSGTDMVLVGDRRIVQATAALALFDICAIYVIPKALATASELNTVYERISSTKIPDDATQDILMFAEPLDDDVAATYTPTIILEVAGQIDGRDYLKEWKQNG